MGGGEKPYRVYRGGRATGAVPLAAAQTLAQAQKRVATAAETAEALCGPGPAQPRRKRRSGGADPARRCSCSSCSRRLGVGTYLALAGGDKAAQKRLGDSAAAALDKQNGLLLSRTTDILVLGTDHSQAVGRAADRHSDSIMLVRVGGGRTVFLSIPRDLRVDIPGHGPDKINAAMQLGGPALAIKTIRTYTSLPVNHVVVLDFSGFKSLIDKVGGVRVNVPAAVYSDKLRLPLLGAALRDAGRAGASRRGRRR